MMTERDKQLLMLMGDTLREQLAASGAKGAAALAALEQTLTEYQEKSAVKSDEVQAIITSLSATLPGIADRVAEVSQQLTAQAAEIPTMIADQVAEKFAAHAAANPPPALENVVKQVVAGLALPELPDIPAMVTEAVSAKLVNPEQVSAMVAELVATAIEKANIAEVTGQLKNALDALPGQVAKAVEDQEQPDFIAMVKGCVDSITLPAPEPIELPDISGMIDSALTTALVGVADEIRAGLPDTSLPDLDQQVRDAVKSAISELPDIDQAITTAISAIAVPDYATLIAEELKKIEMPDYDALFNAKMAGYTDMIRAEVVKEVSAIPVPDYTQVAAKAAIDAVALLPVPEPTPLPDIDALVKTAISALPTVPPPELPDIAAMVDDAVKTAIKAIPAVEPFELPDIPAIVKNQIAAIEMPDITEAIRGEVASQVLALHSKMTDTIAGLNLDREQYQKAVAELEKAQQAYETALSDMPSALEKAVADHMHANPIQPPELPDFEAITKQHVANAIAELPAPVTAEAVQSTVAEQVAEQVTAAVQALPPAEFPDIGQMVTAAVDTALPRAVSQAVSAIEIPDVEEAVKTAIAAIELPAPPELPDIDGIIAAKLAELPAPRTPEDGKDALAIEIVPEIDVNKSYSRGTYAKHAGGLWRAYEKTHAMRGWENIVNGIAGIKLSVSDDLRTLTIEHTDSEGAVTAKHISVPVVLDRGVYKHGETYQQGDGVTFGGSFWIAQAETTDKPGDVGAKGWRLAVKKGRDSR